MNTTNKYAVKKRALSGMSLVELMLALAILAIILTVATSLLSGILNVGNVSNRLLQDERDTRAALLQVTRSIHQYDLDLPNSDFTVGDNVLTLGEQFDFELETDATGQKTLVDHVSGLVIADNIEVFRSDALDINGNLPVIGEDFSPIFFQVTIQGEHGMEVTTKVKFMRGS